LAYDLCFSEKPKAFAEKADIPRRISAAMGKCYPDEYGRSKPMMARMNGVTTISFSSAVVLCTSVASAMPVPQYDKMSSEERARYITLLVKGSQALLLERGQSTHSERLLEFFEDTSKKGLVAEFKKNLHVVRAVNRINAENRYNKQPPYQVEDAFALTLKNDGINLPVDKLLKINQDFKAAETAK
jgi:hypothetical protein